MAVNEEFTKYGDMDASQVAEFNPLQCENARPKKLVADRCYATLGIDTWRWYASW